MKYREGVTMKRNIKNIEKLDLLKKELSELQRMSNENMNKIDSIILKFEEIVRNMKGVTMEQDIKILERMLKIEKECLHYDVSQDEIRAIEHLIKAYKELEKELNSVKEIYYTQKEIEENYIPVSLVEEKIEEVNKEDENLMYKNNIIKILQELLEKRK